MPVGRENKYATLPHALQLNFPSMMQAHFSLSYNKTIHFNMVTYTIQFSYFGIYSLVHDCASLYSLQDLTGQTCIFLDNMSWMV